MKIIQVKVVRISRDTMSKLSIHLLEGNIKDKIVLSDAGFTLSSRALIETFGEL